MRSSTAFLASCLAHLAIAAPIPVIRVLSSSIPPPTVQGYHHPPASLVVGASEACEQDRLAIDNLPITPPATASPDVALDVPVPIHTTYLLSLYRHHRMQNAEVERALREEFCQIHGTTVPVQYAGIGAGWGDAGRIFPCRHVARLRHDTQHRHVFVVFGAACLFLLLLATEAWMYLPLRYVNCDPGQCLSANMR